MKNTKDILKNINEDIKILATNSRAESNAWFFKTGKGQYGEGDLFIGLTVPNTRKIAKKYFEEIDLVDTEKLLQNKIHEKRLLALEILKFKFEKPAQKDLRKEIFELYFKNLKYINNWDLVDTSAYKIVGEYLKEKYALKTKSCTGVRFLLSLASDKCVYANPVLSPALSKGDGEILTTKINLEKLWEKRIAIVATFAFMKDTNKMDLSPTLSQGKGETQNANAWDRSEIVFEIVQKILNEKSELNNHDLLQKACGWMLREYGKRVDEDKMKDFLHANFGKIKSKRTLLRYAIERLSKSERAYWMSL
jgi:3-methyladenine DNA glycosylase AlkD